MSSSSTSLCSTYIGRFAPSPSGSLHLGSLFTALAGFLDARHHNGKWLVRIDDLDKPRNVMGADRSILEDLVLYGLFWDDTVSYQSQHQRFYQQGLDTLLEQRKLYPCICSRKQLRQNSGQIYPGFCRERTETEHQPYALRVKSKEFAGSFTDCLQGNIQYNLATDCGDFIVKRKDGIFAYQYAVVIDDHLQRVTHVVRGSDLLDSTPRQLYLQQLLGYCRPTYLHLPILIDSNGNKLSKQTHAPAVDRRNPAQTLFKLLKLLQQNPPDKLFKADVTELLTWAVAHWEPTRLQNVRTITL